MNPATITVRRPVARVRFGPGTRRTKRAPVGVPACDIWADLRRHLAPVASRAPGLRIFRTRRSRLDELKPGEKLLILLEHAGIGDHLIASLLFPAIQEQYPHVHVTYACPRRFHDLFAGSGLSLLSHDVPVQPAWLEVYHLIEDINVPCHAWERFFVAHGGTNGTGGNGLKWRNRLDIFSRWFGLRVSTPQTCIRIREEERAEARRILSRTGVGRKPVCLLAPFSASPAKCYPWFSALATGLTAKGWAVRLLHPQRVPAPVPTLAGLSIRQMGAVCSVADLIVSVDSAAFHWGGILRRPTVGIFNSNEGVAYCRYYPTASPVQTCSTPCIHNIRWGTDFTSCPRLTADRLPTVPRIPLSRCFGHESVGRILATVRESAGHPTRVH